MKKRLCLLLAVMLVLCLTACGGAASDDPILGKYEGYSYEMLGFAYEMSEIYPDGDNYIELKDGGKCRMVLSGDGIDGTWDLNGSDIVVTVEGQPSNGTLEDGVLYLDFLNAGMNMVFAKPGADVPEIESTGLDDWDDDWDDDWSFETTGEPYDGSIQALDYSTVGLYLPDGFTYDSNWSAWSNGDVNIWLADASMFETAEDMYFWLDGEEYQEFDCGDYYVYMVEDPESFYGAATQYYVDFGGEMGGFEACRLMVTSFSGDMDATQTDDIYDMLAGISVIE